jgi:hypothetical protein
LRTDNFQLDDPGKLVLFGYSAGSRNAPAFDWVKNLTSTHTSGAAEAKNIEASSVCALVWNMIRSRLPDEVVEDFDKFVSGEGLMRMDAKSAMAGEGSKGNYTVQIGETQFNFCGAELAPPTGVFAENYSRSVLLLPISDHSNARNQCYPPGSPATQICHFTHNIAEPRFWWGWPFLYG